MIFFKQMDRQADARQTAIMELPVAAKTATTSPDVQARSRLSPSVILIGGIQAGYQNIHEEPIYLNPGHADSIYIQVKYETLLWPQMPRCQVDPKP